MNGFTSQNSSIRVNSVNDGPDLFVDGSVICPSTKTPFNACVNVYVLLLVMPKTTEENEMMNFDLIFHLPMVKIPTKTM